MMITEKVKNMLGLIWKIVSSAVIVIMFVFTFFSDARISSAKETRDILELKTGIVEIIPKIVFLEKQASERGVTLSTILLYFQENKATLKEIQTAVGEQSILASELKVKIDQQDRNDDKFDKILNDRLERIENKIDGRR